MKTLNRSEYVSDSQSKSYTLPYVLRQDTREISFVQSLVVSAVLHPIIVLLIWAVLSGLAILGIQWPVFEKPPEKIKDIEFVLVDKTEQPPIDKNTKFRSDRDSRAGGKNNPNLPIVEPEPAAPRSVPQTPAPRPTPVSASRTTPSSPPRPTPQKTNSNAYQKNIKTPIPTARMPKAVSPTSSRSNDYLDNNSGKNSPSPILGTGSTKGKNRYASGYSYGSGNTGNPSPGNPNGTPGIDAIREPDMGPYMRELQRRIKKNWDPPRGTASKRVVLLFNIARDGRLLGMSLYKSSGDPATDRAAMSAVEITAPFRTLPPEYRDDSAQIEFTFDYNVFGVTSN